MTARRSPRDGPPSWTSAAESGEAVEGAGGVSVSAEYEGWNDFAVRLGVERDPPGEDPLWADILFERRGIWAWRVTGARVSPDAIPLLTR